MSAVDKSRFVVGAIIEREVTLPDGSVETFHFAKPSGAEVRRWQYAEQTGGDALFFGMQRLIAQSLFDPATGKLVFTLEDSKGILWEACELFMPHVLEVAGIGKSIKKNLPSAEESGSPTS